MRILVTGANGFIGKALCQALVQQGDEVLGLVRSGQLDIPGVTVVHAALEDEHALEQALVNADCVVHLAARAHLLGDAAQDSLAEFRSVNRDATLRLAELARKAQVKRFMFMSSVGVNGSHSGQQAFTESSPAVPHSAYAQFKLEAEQGLQALLQDGAMELVVIRPPLVYGPQAPGNFRRLLRLVSTGALLPFSLVHNQRSLLALENLIDFIVLSCRHPQAANQLYLVADDQSVSTREIVEYLAHGMSRRCINLPVPAFLLRWGLGLLGKGSLHTQLCGSLEICNDKARSLGWVPARSASDALAAAGRDYLLQQR